LVFIHQVLRHASNENHLALTLRSLHGWNAMPGLSRSGQNKSAIGNKINRFDVEKIFKQM